MEPEVGKDCPLFTSLRLGDLKMAHDSYIILATCAMRDYFPDREVVCLLGHTTEYPYVSWFLRFLKESLTGLEVAHQSEINRSRKDRMDEVRYRLSLGALLHGLRHLRI